MQFNADKVVSSAMNRSNSRQDDTKSKTAAKTIYWLYVVSIILTTVEIPDLNMASSISAIVCLFLLLCFSFKQYIFHPMVWLLLVMSIASGFSGPLLDTRQAENKAFCESIIGNTECIEQTIEGLYILGIPIKDISRMVAVKEGKLNKLDFNDYVRGYGLISLARVTVMGS